jgi:hypothetical protein
MAKRPQPVVATTGDDAAAKRTRTKSAISLLWANDVMEVLRAFRKKPSRRNLSASISALTAYQQAKIDDLLGDGPEPAEEPADTTVVETLQDELAEAA